MDISVDRSSSSQTTTRNVLPSAVATQRRQYRIMVSGSGLSTPMTESRARRLEGIGFKWSSKDPRHIPWEARYDELMSFVKKYGHAQVPIGWTVSSTGLLLVFLYKRFLLTLGVAGACRKTFRWPTG